MTYVTSPSFERIDYSLRTNKNIERKLVFDHLRGLQPPLDFSSYRYLGFGSLWFVDFVLAHRALGIRQLCSIERSENSARAEFNKPYACIEVRPGDATDVIESISDAEWKQPHLAWLDYDGIFDESARKDCERFMERAAAGSIVIVTANGVRQSYKRGTPDNPKPVIETLREQMGDAVPSVVPGGLADVDQAAFPQFLARTISNFMAGTLRACGREVEGMPARFIPLFEVIHRDGATMVTIGGLIASWRMLTDLEKHFGADANELYDGGGRLDEVLDLIPLTIKEKLALDELLPCEEAQMPARLEASRVRIPADHAIKYRKLYPHFPLFGEMGF